LAQGHTDLFDFGHLGVFEGETMIAKRSLGILHQAATELGMFDRSPDHGADHLIAHV
jgi:hypothetical protein